MLALGIHIKGISSDNRYASCLGRLLFLMVGLSPLYGMTQTRTDSIKEITIRSEGEKKPEELKNLLSDGQMRLDFDQKILDFYQISSIANLLEEQSPVFVKTYGVNSLATMSVRGASAAQSLVLWEGIPINNAALGTADLSLLSGSLFEQVSLLYGASSALWGSANVGGALLLSESPPDFRPHQRLQLDLSGGSFGLGFANLQGSWQNNHWRFKVKTFYQQADNDFPYLNDRGTSERMTHAHIRAGGALMSLDYLVPHRKSKAIKKEVWSLKLWWQQYHREIPPALFEAFSRKEQKDAGLRTLFSWKQEREQSEFYLKTSYEQSSLQYQDGVVLTNSENTANQVYSELGWLWSSTKGHEKAWQQQILFFSPLSLGFARTGARTEVHQWRPAIVGGYRLSSPNGVYRFNLMFRNEWWDRQDHAALPGANTSILLAQRNGTNVFWQLRGKGSIQKTFRVPNLTELYFQPGGNDQLRAERGWSEQVGLAATVAWDRSASAGLNSWLLEHQSAVFNRVIKDWIYWLGGAIWTPHNLSKVHSRGVETETKLSLERPRAKWALSFNSAYVLATTLASYLPGDSSIGKQIPYTPRYNYAGGLSYSRLNWEMSYHHQYTGYRFTTTDESDFLLPYQVGNIQLAYHWSYNKIKMTLAGQIKNLWHERYEVVNGRPMPGRHFWLSVRLIWGD